MNTDTLVTTQKEVVLGMNTVWRQKLTGEFLTILERKPMTSSRACCDGTAALQTVGWASTEPTRTVMINIQLSPIGTSLNTETASMYPPLFLYKTFESAIPETNEISYHSSFFKFTFNKMELLQSQAPAEWVLKGLECSRIKKPESRKQNHESRIQNQESRIKSYGEM